jgi:NhaP-type Na+/H+ or K+/H+ antiporter
MNGQINLQIALNPENKSHMQLWKWINEQTTNRSSFIRETLFMRMMGIIGVVGANLQMQIDEELDRNEVMRLIEV